MATPSRQTISERLQLAAGDLGKRDGLSREDCDRLAYAVLGLLQEEAAAEETSAGERGAEPEVTASVEDTVLLLLMVEDEFPAPLPTGQEVSQWDPVTRSSVAAWAFAVHLVASDNDVHVPPLPEVLREAHV